MPSLAIAAPQRSAAETGAATFAAGGNALDAALAAAVSLTVSYPHNCALGGDLIAVVRAPDGNLTVVNASGPAPAMVDVAALRAAGAAIPWAAAFGPAIEQAEHGVTVTPSLAAAFAASAPLLAADEGTRALLGPGGAPPTAGATLRQPALAATLRRLAHDGRDALYRGPIGASLVACLRALGSAMTASDLA